MHKRSLKTTVNHLLFSSFIPPGICLSIFALYILAQFVRVPVISSLGPALLVTSNAALLAIIALRFFRYARGLRRDLRYDAEERPRRGAVALMRSAEQARKEFVARGFRFDPNGRYGERRNLAHLGTTLLYGGLFLALVVGTVDYLRQYSGAVFQGVGLPMDLSNSRGYFSVVKGPLASTSGLPQLSVTRQILPDRQWPKGATEIALLAKDRSVLATGTIGAAGGKPLSYRGYEYHFSRNLYDVMLAIKTANGHVEFDDMIKLSPAESPEGGYAFASRFLGERYRWMAFFNPATKGLRLVALDKKGNHVNDGVILFQREPTKNIGSFGVQFSALSQWSELHIVRSRHMTLLGLGVLLALGGGLLRICFRPQRVWLDAEAEGCRVWTTGSCAHQG